ncbi:hypothetical protein HDU78_010081 [Chytriomyces hyalinus]|nr:hypothetical protein HDU78_010081 [Chytriomyces hyalinus]
MAEPLYNAIAQLYQTHQGINVKDIAESGVNSDKEESDNTPEAGPEAAQEDNDSSDSDLDQDQERSNNSQIVDDVRDEPEPTVTHSSMPPPVAGETTGKAVAIPRILSATNIESVSAKSKTDQFNSPGSLTSKSRSSTPQSVASKLSGSSKKRERPPAKELTWYQQKKMRDEEQRNDIRNSLRGNEASGIESSVSAYMAFSMQQQTQQQQQQQQQQMQQMQQQQQPTFWSTIGPALVPVLAPMLAALANQFLGEQPAPGDRGNAGQFPVHATNLFCAQPQMQDFNNFRGQPGYNDVQRQPQYNDQQRHAMQPAPQSRAFDAQPQYNDQQRHAVQPAPQSRTFDAFNSLSPLFGSGA